MAEEKSFLENQKFPLSFLADPVEKKYFENLADRGRKREKREKREVNKNCIEEKYVLKGDMESWQRCE